MLFLQACNAHTNIQEPKEEQRKPEQSAKENDAHRTGHMKLCNRSGTGFISAGAGMQSGKKAGHNEDKKRSRYSCNHTVNSGKPCANFFRSQSRTERKICAVNEKKNKDRRFTRIPIPERSPIKFSPDGTGYCGQQAEHQAANERPHIMIVRQ